MKLTYWISEYQDSPSYSIRRKTRREVKEALESGDWYVEDYGKIHKITIEYENALDLLQQCLGEGGINESK